MVCILCIGVQTSSVLRRFKILNLSYVLLISAYDDRKGLHLKTNRPKHLNGSRTVHSNFILVVILIRTHFILLIMSMSVIVINLTNILQLNTLLKIFLLSPISLIIIAEKLHNANRCFI